MNKRKELEDAKIAQVALERYIKRLRTEMRDKSRCVENFLKGARWSYDTLPTDDGDIPKMPEFRITDVEMELENDWEEGGNGGYFETCKANITISYVQPGLVVWPEEFAIVTGPHEWDNDSRSLCLKVEPEEQKKRDYSTNPRKALKWLIARYNFYEGFVNMSTDKWCEMNMKEDGPYCTIKSSKKASSESDSEEED